MWQVWLFAMCIGELNVGVNRDGKESSVLPASHVFNEQQDSKTKIICKNLWKNFVRITYK